LLFPCVPLTLPAACRLPPRALLEFADPLAVTPFGPTFAEPCAAPLATVCPDEFVTVPDPCAEPAVCEGFTLTDPLPAAVRPLRPVALVDFV
jgi:hypothetical protein